MNQQQNGQKHEQPRQVTPLQMALMKMGQGEAVIRLKDEPPGAVAIRGTVLAMQDGILIVQLAGSGRIKLVNRDAWATIEESAVTLANAMPVPQPAVAQ